MGRLICTMYWDNIDPTIVETQRRVFAHLGFNIRQDNATGIQHGEWRDKVLAKVTSDDAVLFVDIDCFPLTSEAVTKAFVAAESGRIFGVAQTANHLPECNLIYAAPSFLGLSRATWTSLGQVSMARSLECDVGMALTQAAVRQGFPIDILSPSFVCCPKWPLGHFGAVGYGTFYNGEVFHLFQSRHNKAYEFAFHYVAECVIRGDPVDHLLLFQWMNSPMKLLEDSIRCFPRNTRQRISNVRKLLFSRTADLNAWTRCYEFASAKRLLPC